MHKPIIILIGLLVVLLPFGSSNIINHANAIAFEDEYYTDQYNERYANDDHYGPEQDQSYSYDNDYKSKDRDKEISVSISKINCNSVNYNVIGNVNGNNNIGTDERGEGTPNPNGAISSNAYGNTNEKYNEGYQKDNNGVSCIINNNNTIITGDEGNATDDNDNVIAACEDCIEIALGEQLQTYLNFLAGLGVEEPNNLEELCIQFQGLDEESLLLNFEASFTAAGLVNPAQLAQDVVDCLVSIGFVT